MHVATTGHTFPRQGSKVHVRLSHHDRSPFVEVDVFYSGLNISWQHM